MQRISLLWYLVFLLAMPLAAAGGEGQPASLNFLCLRHGTRVSGVYPETRSLAVNMSADDVAWELTSSDPWVKLIRPAGTGPGESTVAVNCSGLESGVYHSRVLLRQEGAENGGELVQEFPVLLHVIDAGVKKDWTVLVLIDADQLSDDEAFGEFEAAGSSVNVNLVVLLDDVGLSGSWYYYLMPDTKPGRDSPVVKELREVNLGDPKVLADFLHFGLTNFPAKHYCLILRTCGWGWMFLGAKDLIDDDRLSNDELRQAMAKGLQGTGKLDLLLFGSSGSQTVELAYSLKDFARYMMASENYAQPGGNWRYGLVISKLSSWPGASPLDLARMIIEDYTYSTREVSERTFSLVDLARIEDLAERVSTLADELLLAMPEHKGELSRVLSEVRRYDIDSVDLYHLAFLLAAAGLSPEVAAAAESVMEGVQETVLLQKPSSRDHGISIYYPNKALYEHYEHDPEIPMSYTETVFAKNTHWDELISDQEICVPPDSLIACGESRSASLSGPDRIGYYNCFKFPQQPGVLPRFPKGPEHIYQLSVPSAGTISVNLESPGNKLQAFLLEGHPEGACPSRCLETGRLFDYHVDSPGDFYLVVESNPRTGAGDYTLHVDCTAE